MQAKNRELAETEVAPSSGGFVSELVCRYIQVTEAAAAEVEAAAQHAAQLAAKVEGAEKLAAATAKQHSKPDMRMKAKIDELQARAACCLRHGCPKSNMS